MRNEENMSSWNEWNSTGFILRHTCVRLCLGFRHEHENSQKNTLVQKFCYQWIHSMVFRFTKQYNKIMARVMLSPSDVVLIFSRYCGFHIISASISSLNDKYIGNCNYISLFFARATQIIQNQMHKNTQENGRLHPPVPTTYSQAMKC